MPIDEPHGTWFRRLLLGTLIELVQEAEVPIAISSIQIAFHPDSAFRVPRFNNYMRFRGEAQATVSSPVSSESMTALQGGLRRVWPGVLSTVVVPGDQLTSTKNETSAEVAGDLITIAFDLIAD